MMAPETVVTVETNKASPGQQPQRAGALSWIKINVEYFTTLPGILKLVELVFGILCMSLGSPALRSGTHWFLFVAVTSFITTLIWAFVYFLSVREALDLPINWPLSELINMAATTVLYFIGFIVQFAAAGTLIGQIWYGSQLAAAVFGLFNTAAYAVSTFLIYKESRAAVGTTA